MNRKLIEKIQQISFLSQPKILITSIIIFILIIGLTGSFIGDLFIDKTNWVIKIDNTYIGPNDFEKEFNAMKQDPRNFGKTDQDLKMQLLNIIAIRETFKKEMNQYGINITNEVVKKVIQQDNRFSDDNQQFSSTKFEEFLHQSGLTESMFFENVKNRIINNVVGSFGENFISLGEKEAALIDKSRKQNRIFDVYTLSASDIKINDKIAQNEIAEFYNKNQELFKIPNTYDISYIDGINIADQIDYQPSEEEIKESMKSNPDQKRIDAIKAIREGNICQILDDLLKNINSRSDLDAIAQNYDLKLRKLIGQKLDQFANSTIKNLSINDLTIKNTGQKCYNFILSAIDKENENGYVSFEKAKNNIMKKIISQKQNVALDEIITKINKITEKNRHEINTVASLLKENHFKKEEKLKSNRESGKLNMDLISQVFTHKPQEFTDAIKVEDKIKIAFTHKIIKELPKTTPKEIDNLTKAIQSSKSSDIYKLYYMDLQDKYSIKINEEYFNAQIIK